MQIGINQNVDVGGRELHVQTEDVPDRNEVVTQVFYGGRVLHSYRHSYAEWKSEPSWEQKVSEQARKQHNLMVAAAMRGRFDDKT